jgi:predicted anti-sigma-YlaC factor YlaD
MLLASLICLAGSTSSCSIIKGMAMKSMAGAMAQSSVVYARDEDPELVGDALPFLLKTVEGLLVQEPNNESLLLTACQGFTSYAQAYVAVPADYREAKDLEGAREERVRATRLFLRGRKYGLRALELSYPGISKSLVDDPDKALAKTKKKDVPLLFWTGAAWGGAISTSKTDMDLVADLGVANALLQRANALDPHWNRGAIHEVLIALEAARSGGNGGSVEAARKHFETAVTLSQGKKAGPYVTLAQSVSIKEQNLAEFRHLLETALAVNLDASPDDRLANVLAQRRARWLLAHTGDYFIDYDEGNP